MTIKTKITSTLFTLCCALEVTSLHANTITVNTWNDTDTPTAGYTYSVNDNTAGRFSFGVSVPQNDADMLAIAFNIASFTYNAGNIDVQNFLATSRDGSTQTASTGLYFATSSCGTACNFNGVPVTPFDVILRVGDQGSSLDNWFYDVSFDIAANGLTLADFEHFGVRGQTVLGSNSDKAYQDTPCPNASVQGVPCNGVPEPASLGMFALGIAGIAWGIRRKQLNS